MEKLRYICAIIEPGERLPACRLIPGVFGCLVLYLPGHYRRGEAVSDLNLIGRPGIGRDGILPAVVDPLPFGIHHRIRKGAAGINGHQRPGYFRHSLLTSLKGLIETKTACPSTNANAFIFLT